MIRRGTPPPPSPPETLRVVPPPLPSYGTPSSPSLPSWPLSGGPLRLGFNLPAPSLRTDSRPTNLMLLLLLTCLLHSWQCARGQSSYTIDTVSLKILPSSTVQSGTPVTLRCQVRVSHDNIPHLTHTFQLRRDDVPIHSSTTTEDSLVYELNPARAADSGSYECRVKVKDKSRNSDSQKLNVT
ncbi:platelet endothelial cell adhesion molecule-like, partial [Notothenia coriiceps]|uniref:Platelet endothelial cell adhesion molecule-like n=1 Tax=Notothenia coriiceps TaxID=8208 RepID=A0A6I9N935_9TELE